MNTKKPSLGSILEDDTGGYSMMRAMFALVTISIMLVWGYNCYSTNVLQPIPKEGVTLIIGLAGCKAWQRYSEGKEALAAGPEVTPTTPEPPK